MAFGTEALRNIALCGHGGTGKTTLTEYLLWTANAIPKAEAVESGKTVSDYSEEEIARKMSIHTSLSHLIWNNVKINLLDTPGIADFVGETVAAFRAAETAILLVGADVGAQIETVKLWRRLSRDQHPRLFFINKMDKEHADFAKTLSDLKEKFKVPIIPITIPVGNGNSFKGIIDLITMKFYTDFDGKKFNLTDIPAEYKDYAQNYRNALIEAAAEGDDNMIEKFFVEGTLSDEEIIAGLKSGINSCRLFPALCGSTLNNAGLQNLLDFIVKVCPAPQGELKAKNSKAEEITCKIDQAEPASCFVFKTAIDQFSGKMSYIKVLTGKILPETELINSRGDKKEKIGRLQTALGKKLVEVDSLAAGDIGLLLKLASVETNDTLCSAERVLSYEPLAMPQPVHSVAISATSKKDEDKLNQLLLRAAEEDLTFKLNFNTETKETVVSCMGELQLSIILDKIKEKQKIEIETRIPKVPYRETLQGQASAEYTHKKQTGGHGQYAKVVLEIRPLPRGENFKFVNAIFGGAIPKNYIPGVEKGVLEGMEHGILAGYPVVDIEAKVVDGKDHPVDSSE